MIDSRITLVCKLVSRFKFSSLCLLALGNCVWAQSAPDAGVLQQQIEQERNKLPPGSKPLPKITPAAPKAIEGGLQVSVRRFEFDGNTLLSQVQLAAAVSQYINRPLTFADLQAACAAVADAYQQSGWLVRAFLPQQELNAGVVRIQVVEAVFGGVRIESADPATTPRVSVERMRQVVEQAQPPGKPISTRLVDRALLLLNELPGVSVSQGSLAEGRADRETDLQVKIANRPLISGDVRVDNSGSRSTGRERLSANAALASPTSIGDLLGANLLHTQGSDYGRLSYLLPLGAAGWTAGVNGSVMHYRLIGRDFEPLDASGSANTAGLEFNYPLYRSQQASVGLNLAAEHKAFDNSSGGAKTTHYGIDIATLSLNSSVSDTLGNGGRLGINLNASFGYLDLSDSPNRASDAATTKSAGRFGKFRYVLNRQQNFGESLFFLASYSGQLANRNLDSAEKFYLGGVSGVRAYPSSEGGGTDGQLLNLELHARLPANLDLLGFYDWGAVRVNRDNDFAGAAALNRFSLKGAGLGLGWNTSSGANLRAIWARRIGNNPNATAAGSDQDGTRIRDRAWLSAGYAF